MKIIKQNATGLYLVEGRGFVGTKATATQFSPEDVGEVQSCAKAMGLGESTVECAGNGADQNIKQNADGTSFAVSFVRKNQLEGGNVKAHRLNPSKRRFATEAEAELHGARFKKIEKHLGFYVTKTNDPVNAYVNKITGKTNPVIGRGRVNR